jgi:AmmeMemoRadiSam system protein B
MIRKVFAIAIILLCCLAAVVYIRKSHNAVTPTHISGIILPHHLLAASIIQQSIDRLQHQIAPTHVVILATNHFLPQGFPYITDSSSSAKLASFPVEINDALVNQDHSVQSLIPFISRAFPTSTVVPILVSAHHEPLEYYQVNGRLLSTLFDPTNTLFVASVDFAHNVSLEQGVRHNDQTIEMLRSFSYKSLLQLHDDYVDSPTTVATFLSIMQSISANNWETWYSTHGAQIENRLDAVGTSYVVGTYSKSTQ